MSLSINTILFSGRMDPVHPGHIITIKRLLKKCQKVIVVMLDYPERRYPMAYCMDILKESLDGLPVEVISNTVHFGKITKKQLSEYDFEVYATGNLIVLRHIEKLGVKVMYCDRAYLYEASKIPMPQE